MTKQLAIVPAGGGEVKEVTIGPGTTVEDVKRYTQLEKFLLSRPGSADYFADCEVLYPVVADGDKLVATFLTKVGSLQGPTVLALILAIAILIGLLRRLISEVRSWKPGQSTAATGQTQLATATFEPAWVPHPAPVVVTPDTRPYWVQKGWRCEGNDYHGYYRTGFGSWQGFIAARSPSLTTAYIYDPPPALLQGPHSLCFSDAGDGWFKIHFSVGTSDVNSAIIAIEKVIQEAFLCATTR